MEEHVGGFLVEPLVGLVAGRARDLLGLLLDLRAVEREVVEEADDVRAVGALARALGDDALERGQRLVRRRRLELAAVKARARAGVARRPGRLDEREDRVAVAIEAQRLDEKLAKLQKSSKMLTDLSEAIFKNYWRAGTLLKHLRDHFLHFEHYAIDVKPFGL